MNRGVLLRLAANGAGRRIIVAANTLPSSFFTQSRSNISTLVASGNSSNASRVGVGGPIASTTILNGNFCNNINHSANHNDPLRYFSSRGARKKNIDPFKVLKIKKTATYKSVKKKFLMIAMKYHPDTNKAASPEEEEEHRNIFIKARQAFELLAEDEETGLVSLRTDLDEDNIWSDKAMDAWFKEETGFDMPFMDPETMREVAKMTESVGGGGEQRGLDRDGGMWELARMVTRTVKDGGDAKTLLQLEAGATKRINGQLRRTRRRR